MTQLKLARKYLFILSISCLLLLHACSSIDNTDDEPTARLLFCGDLMLDWGVMESCDANGYDYPLGEISSFIKDFDFRFCNLECVISENASPRPGKKYIFRAPPRYLEVLRSAGISGVSLANNHVMDYGDSGLLDTMTNLNESSFLITGAGTDAETASRPLVTNIRGIRLAVIGLCDLPYEDTYARSNGPGIARASVSRVQSIMKQYDQWNDIVAVSIHWGDEYSDYPGRDQVALAHDLIDAGVDIIIGHHPHVYQGVEIYKNRPVIYSLGNFLFGSINEDVRNNLVAGFTADKGGLKKMTIYPIHGTNHHNNPFRPERIGGEKAEEVLTHLVHISMPLGKNFPENAVIRGNAIEFDFRARTEEQK